MPQPKPRRSNQIYWPNCSVCQYMRRNKDFSLALLTCSYFNKKNLESPPMVLERFGQPFATITLYKHLQRHMKGNVYHWNRVFGLTDKKGWQKALAKTKEAQLAATMEVVEAKSNVTTNHEIGLDEFIERGREKLEAGQMAITATTYIQAIKAKAEIENKTKDRRFEALKTLFAGAAPKNNDAS